jgi:hypothetical protein
MSALQVGATYVDSKVLGNYVSSIPVGSVATNTTDDCGEGFPPTPESRVDAIAEYDYPIAGDWTALSRIHDSHYFLNTAGRWLIRSAAVK